jgi:hypothetical protein
MGNLLRDSAMLFVVATSACALAACSPNAQHTKATVSYIDRNCKIVRTTYDGDYKRTRTETLTEQCSHAEDWEKVRSKRNKVADGKAVVHVTYTAPQNGQFQSGELTFDGRDDEFYRLKAGDEIDILVSNADPTKIAKA